MDTRRLVGLVSMKWQMDERIFSTTPNLSTNHRLSSNRNTMYNLLERRRQFGHRRICCHHELVWAWDERPTILFHGVRHWRAAAFHIQSTTLKVTREFFSGWLDRSRQYCEGQPKFWPCVFLSSILLRPRHMDGEFIFLIF